MNVAVLLRGPEDVRHALTDYREVIEDTEVGRATREMLRCAGPLMIRAMLTRELADLLATLEGMAKHPRAAHAFYRAMPKLLNDALERTLPEHAREAMRAYAGRRTVQPIEDPREACNAGSGAQAAADRWNALARVVRT